MLYKDYLSRISKSFSNRFEEIDPLWNFDQGHEFEVSLASLLLELLPDKYGVCRGFVTPAMGEPKGDDIIIYDKLSAPLVKVPTPYEFTRKESVPLEATYAYIEAKNTLEIRDTSKGTHILKAINQTKNVKELVREPRLLTEIVEGVHLLTEPKPSRSGNLPQIFNPLYTVIFARGVRVNGELTENPYKIKPLLAGLDTGDNGPDLIVLGKNLVVAPCSLQRNPQEEVTSFMHTPFCIDGQSELLMWVMPNLAYGFGLASILNALQKIKLNAMPWEQVLQEAYDQSHDESNRQRELRKHNNI